MPQPIQYDAAHLDLSPRFYQSKAVAGSPALAAETIVCSVTVTGDVAAVAGVYLFGWCSFTAGTSAVSATMKIRQTNTSGATVVTSGATLVAAAGIYQPAILGVDTASVLPGQVYVLTLTIGSGAAVSTVSAAQLIAVVV